MIFHPFTLEDQAKLAPYYAAITYPSCEYAFANNFLWSQHYHNTWTELEGCLVLCYPGEGPAYTVLPGSGNPKAAICALRRKPNPKACPCGWKCPGGSGNCCKPGFPER